MNRIGSTLSVLSLQPAVQWAAFLGAVAVFAALILVDTFRVWSVAAGWSMVWPFLLFMIQMNVGTNWWREAITPTVSFTLPGYRESWRRARFASAVRWGVVVAMLLFSKFWQDLLLFWSIRLTGSNSPASFPSAPSVLEMSLGLIGGFFAGMAICLLRTVGGFVRMGVGRFRIPFEWIGLPMGLIVCVWSPEHLFIIWPILLPLSVYFCVYYWRRLGDMECIKNCHRAIILGGTELPSQVPVPARSRARMERPYLDRIRKADVDAVERHLWGWLYLALGSIPLYWRWIALALAVVVLVQGYLSRFFPIEFILLIMGVVTAVKALPVTCDILLPEGRLRCRLTIMAAVLAALLLLAASTAVLGLSWVCAAFLPPISLGTHHWQYVGVHLYNLWLVCLPVPWFFLWSLIGDRVPILRAPVVIAVAVLIVWEFSDVIAGVHNSPARLPALLICGWALFALMLWLTYTRWDLVGQRSGRSY